MPLPSSGNMFPITLLFRSVSSLWTSLGRKLFASEVDENFYQLQEAVNFLAENPTLPKEIDSISVVGSQMTITLSDGITTFGPFTLPMGAFRWTGDFQAAFDYKTFDLLMATSGIYMVLQDFTSGSTFQAGAANSEGPYLRLLMPTPTLYDIGFFFPGTPGAGIADGEAMFTYRFTRDVYFPLDLIDSVVGLATPTTDDLVCPIYKNGSEIGSLTVPAGGYVGTFDFPTVVQFTDGDRIRVLKPDALDATARDLSVTFAALKGVFAEVVSS